MSRSVPPLAASSTEPLKETLWYHALQGALIAFLSGFSLIMRCLAALHSRNES